MVNRREFIGCSMATAAFCMAGNRFSFATVGNESRHPADYIEKLPDGKLKCQLCPNGCIPAEGQNGTCRARGLRDGKYVSLVYGLPCVLAIDPVEKMPLFHYHIKSPALAISTAGCNLVCQYCQNWQFSQKSPAETRNFVMKPEEVVERALDYGAKTLGFFYTEPVIYFEYMKDIILSSKKHQLKTIMVTGGYIEPSPLKELLELVDIFVVGYKGFTEEFYQEVISGSMQPVLNSLKMIKESGRHLEVVSLLIPGKNDSKEHLAKGVEWFANNLGPDVPWHFSRFVPEFLLKNLPPTPNTVLETARKMAMDAGIKFVYTGNNPGQEGNHTYCPSCGKNVVERLGIKVLRSLLKSGKCPDCNFQLPGIWLDDLPVGNI